MKDIFALEVSIEGCTGAIQMVVPAGSFPEAVIEADKTYAAWWDVYRKTPRGAAKHADARPLPSIVNVTLVRRYRSDTRFSHVSRDLAALINGTKEKGQLATPEQIEDVRAIFANDNSIQIRDNAQVSRANGNGVWVQGWLLVENPKASQA